MRDAVVVEAVRTPIGRRNGTLAGWHSADLSAIVLNALTERTGVAPELVDDVIWGCVRQYGRQANNVGRNAVLAAGWPESVPATTIDRQCGSSQQAVHFAAAGLIAGQYDIVVAGGVEIMSGVSAAAAIAAPEAGHPISDSIKARYGVDFNQGVGAEQIARRWNLSRGQLDEFSARSHERLAAAIDRGVLADQIVPVLGADGAVFATDEGLRRGTTVEKLAGLNPAFVDNGQIHAGNSSQISDGASALLLTTSEKAAELGLIPIARVHTATVAGDDPVIMLTGLIPATKKALDRSGLSIDDIGLFEVNEAFAPIPLAWIAETGADPDKVNVNGGAIAIGHPLGASGGRLMTTLLHQMRATGTRYGLQTMCEGGGLGNATILELI
ncbi:MAG: thiolase family protein [Microbacterium sp.]